MSYTVREETEVVNAPKTVKRRANVAERIEAVASLPRDDRSMLLRRTKAFLADRSPRVREKALMVIRDELLRELEAQVLVALADKNSFVRELAIECLGDFHCGERIEMPILYPFLKSSECLTRVETMETLACIGDRKALPLMVTLLGDSEPLVRSYAAVSIASLKGNRYRGQIEAASKVEQTESAKPRFAHALYTLGDQNQFFTLLGLLSSTNCTARCAAANTLADLGLSAEQTAVALAAVVRAKENFIARSDQITMEQVEKQLLEQIEWIKN